MDWIWGLVLALGGALVGALTAWALTHRSEPQPDAFELTSLPASIPEPVTEMLEMLRSATVVVGDHDDVLQSSVQARTYGLVRGTRIAPPALLQAVRDSRASRQLRTVDLEINRGIGAPSVHMTARCAPVADEFIVVLAEDRTAAKRVEETRRDFVANVSHELKTPIGAISLLSEAVHDAAEDPEAVLRFANKLQKESGRLSELVAQIIELSRLQSDDPMISATEVSVDEVIRGAVDRCRELADGREVLLTTAGDWGLEVLGDQGQLTDAITNLVHNAVVYSDRGARVAVSSRRAIDDGDQYVDVSVSDNGIGIAQADLQRIFERFYRVDYARSRESGGTGLGLSIVKHIANVHGGSVSVWSQLGQGSTFTIRLPLLTEADKLRRSKAPRDHREGS